MPSASGLAAPAPSSSAVVSPTLPIEGPPLLTDLPRRHAGKQLVWDPAFHRFELGEAILTAASASIALAAAIVPPRNTDWSHGFGFDERVRDKLRLSSYVERQYARDVSDVLLSLELSSPFLVDSLIVAYWYRGSRDVAIEMALIDAEAIALTAAVQGAVTWVTGRERPYVRDCGSGIPDATIDCTTNSRNRSFFSGHSSLSFTSAGLICSHHLTLDLFESSADEIACATGLAAAAATATLRVVGDQHYLSDVLVGAVIGASIGFGLPALHHYRTRSPERPSAFQWHVMPTLGGVSAGGTF